MAGKTWHNEDRLRELYLEEEMSSVEIADELGCGSTTILRWLENYDIERRDDATSVDEDEPWHDEELLNELYWEDGLSAADVADELDCNHQTVLRSLKRYDLGTRTKKNERPPYYHTEHRGYEIWHHNVNGEKKNVRVHRLAAVAEYGFDAVREMHVHHVNGVEWDNRSENLELMNPSDHGKLHSTDWMTAD